MKKYVSILVSFTLLIAALFIPPNNAYAAEYVKVNQSKLGNIFVDPDPIMFTIQTTGDTLVP